MNASSSNEPSTNWTNKIDISITDKIYICPFNKIDITITDKAYSSSYNKVEFCCTNTFEECELNVK